MHNDLLTSKTEARSLLHHAGTRCHRGTTGNGEAVQWTLRLDSAGRVPTAAHGERCTTSSPGEKLSGSHWNSVNKKLPRQSCDADPGAGCHLWPGGSREQVNKSKSLSRRNTTEANRSWQDTRWKACFGTLLYLNHNNVLGIRTCVLLTSRHLARAGSLRTTCWNSSQCQRLSRALENMAQIADHPSRASPRPHAHSLDQHSLGEKWDLKAIADFPQKGDKSSGMFASG